MSQIVVGTAGHIDHGKTSLVKSLTGTDTDSLIEEKCCDVLQPDITWLGGITEARRVCALASAYDLPIIPTAPLENGAFPRYSTAAWIPFCSSRPIRSMQWFDLLRRSKLAGIGRWMKNAGLYRETNCEPIAGRLIMFPSWVTHCVDPNDSDDLRISVSFNFLQKGMHV